MCSLFFRPQRASWIGSASRSASQSPSHTALTCGNSEPHSNRSDDALRATCGDATSSIRRVSRVAKFRICVQFRRVYAETELCGQNMLTKFRTCVQFDQVHAISELCVSELGSKRPSLRTVSPSIRRGGRLGAGAGWQTSVSAYSPARRTQTWTFEQSAG